MPANNNRPQVTTQIRVLFSPNAYLNIKFFNDLISLGIYQLTGRDQNNKPLWDTGFVTTLNHEDAVQIIQACKLSLKDPMKQLESAVEIRHGETIIDFKISDTKSSNGFVATLMFTKNNKVALFQFESNKIKCQSEANGQMVEIQVQTQLMTFVRILEAYLSGINSDRHLDKMTEERAKQGDQQQQPQNNYNQNQGQNQNYRNNGNWNRNSNGGGNRRWNNNGGGGNRNYNNYRN